VSVGKTGRGAVFSITQQALNGALQSNRSGQLESGNGQREHSVLLSNFPTQARGGLEWATLASTPLPKRMPSCLSTQSDTTCLLAGCIERRLVRKVPLWTVGSYSQLCRSIGGTHIPSGPPSVHNKAFAHAVTIPWKLSEGSNV
jgi:hypothetical protein